MALDVRPNLELIQNANWPDLGCMPYTKQTQIWERALAQRKIKALSPEKVSNS